MLRRDYILDQIKEFAGVLAKILGLAEKQEWESASAITAEESKRLTGLDLAHALQLSDTELFSRLVQGEPTHIAQLKALMLAALLKASGDALEGQGRTQESQAHYLKGLHLLLETLELNAIDERPEFVPSVEGFLIGLGDAALPVQTHAMLMRHYERSGEFAKAEDALFAISEAEPPGAELLQFGEAFYQRLLGQSDAALLAGNLPRAEAQAGLEEFRAAAGEAHSR